MTRKADSACVRAPATYQPPATQLAAMHDTEDTPALPPVLSPAVPGTFSAFRQRPLTSVAIHACHPLNDILVTRYGRASAAPGCPDHLFSTRPVLQEAERPGWELASGP